MVRVTEPRQIAVVRSGQAYNAYEAFLQALLKRRAELGISSETLDDIAGLTTRYSQKLLTEIRVFGSDSFGSTLGGLGLGIIIFEDEEALQLVQKRLEGSPIDETQVRVHANARMRITRWLFSPRKASAAAKKRWSKVPKAKRIQHARELARKRWSTPRIVEITKSCQGLGDAPNRTAKTLEPSAQLASRPRKRKRPQQIV